MLNKKNNKSVFVDMQKILKTVGIFLSVLIIFACSTSYDSSNREVSGVVADGYLKGAMVFLDCDKDFIKTNGEAYTLSGEGGKYTISDTLRSQRECQLVADATAINVVDEDDGKTLAEAGRKGFKLVAPPGSEFISPLTTVAHVVTDADADIVLEKLGITNALTALGITDMSGKEFLLANFMDYQDDGTSEKSNAIYEVRTTARMMAYMMSVKQFTDVDGVDVPCQGKSCVTPISDIVEVLTSVYQDLTNDVDFDTSTAVPMFDSEEVKTKMNEKIDALTAEQKEGKIGIVYE